MHYLFEPFYADVYENRGLAELLNAQYDAALADFNKSIQYAPSKKNAFYYRGLTKFLLEDYQDAIVDFEHFQQMHPSNHLDDTFFHIGVAYFYLKNFPKALYYLELTIKRNEKHSEAYFYRGLLFVEWHEQSKALKDFKKARELGFSEADNLVKKTLKNHKKTNA